MKQCCECTIKELTDFLISNPKYIGKIEVETRHGYYPIDFAGITEFNSPVIEIVTENTNIKTSPDHLLFSEGKWNKVKNLVVGNTIDSKYGKENIHSISFLKQKYDLYDIGVRDVHEFYANGLVSHNSATILDSIHFGLFGKAFRNVNKPSIINSINLSECLVEVEFKIGDNDYKVIRGIKPNVFEIYKNKKLINKESAIKDYQKYLETIILSGLNERVFKQVVVIGSANYTPFMQLSPAARREFIEELLDIKIFGSMLSLAKNKFSKFKDELKQMDWDVEIQEKKIELEESNNKKLKSQNTKHKINLFNKCKIEEESIENKETNIIEIESLKEQYEKKLISKFPKIKKSITEIEELFYGLCSTKRLINENLNFFKNNKNCPTCQQTIIKEYKDNIILQNNNKLQKIEIGIKNITIRLKEYKKKENIYLNIQEKISKLDRKIYEQQTNISSHKRYIKTLRSEIRNIDNEIRNIDKTLLLKLKKSLYEIKHNREKLIEEKQYYDLIINMLKDDGIKTRIIKQYIPIINTFINEYLDRFGLPIEFTLNEQFEEVIKSRYRDNFQYNNFSEGEKERINLSILLAWRQLARMKNTINCNILIMDEVMDGHLDPEAREELMNMLLEMDKNTNLFVISHISDAQLAEKMDSVINFEKKGNFTSMKRL